MTTPGERAAELITQASKEFYIQAAQTANTRSTMEDDEQGADPVVEDEIYEVDRILQTKMHGRKRMFLVRWKNYGEEADSWEPEDLLLDGAEETVKEFMLKYEEEKQTKKKSTPKRGRPSKSGSIASSKSGLNDSSKNHISDDSDKGLSSDASDSDGGYNPKNKKARKTRNSIKGKPPPQETTKTLPTRIVNLNKKPWFMDSSSESESEKQQKSSLHETDIPSTSHEDNHQNGIIAKIKIKPTSTLSAAAAASSIDHDQSEDKKTKKEKHKKKKSKLMFEGVFRREQDKELCFIARRVEGSTESQVLSQEEAIETDARSLARYLIEKITFKIEGSPVIQA